MDSRPTAPKPDDPPARRGRTSVTGSQRSGSGEGSRSALERLIELEKAKQRAQAFEQPDEPDEVRRVPRP